MWAWWVLVDLCGYLLEMSALWITYEYWVWLRVTKVPLCNPQIPKSYLLLQDAVMAERQRRDAEDEVQYLTDLELEKIIEENPASDIKDYEDLQTGKIPS